MSKLVILKQIIEQIKTLVPPGCRVDMDRVMTALPDEYQHKPSIWIFNCVTYEEGTRILREFGCGEREKEPDKNGHTNIHAETDGIEFHVVCKTLPPTCHLVKTKKMVPKKETRVIESTEMIEVELTEVVCTGGNDAAKTEFLKT